MKVFLSSLEIGSGQKACKNMIRHGTKFHYNLMSYYYITKAEQSVPQMIRDNSEQILVDSGAHSFQFGKKVNFTEYTKEYANFIKDFDRSNIVGFFEMDIENIIGYEKVLELRKTLEDVTDKIIPVWHPQRGIDEFFKMCEQYSKKVIAIGGFKGTDIKDEQYIMFLKYARKYGCKVHCLGMTRKAVLDKVPFDFTDSSSWAHQAIFGKVGKDKATKEFSKLHRDKLLEANYKQGMKMQEHYYTKWRKVCND